MAASRPSMLVLGALSVLATAWTNPDTIMFPSSYGPIVAQPQEEQLGGRIQSRRPVERAASALRGVAARLRVLVAPSGGHALNDEGANLLMSPLSVAAALGEMLLGAQGETRELLSELLAAPGMSGVTHERDGVVGVVPDLDFHQQFKALLDQLTTVSEMTGVDLRVASAFFAQRGLPLRVDFQHALHDLYHADVQSIDFRERPAVAQASVNAWARQATRGRIPTVLAAPLPPSALALVASAVYFNGAWKMPFDTENSVNGWFRMNSRRRVAVRYMRSHFSELRYAENTSQGYRLVVLPYKDGRTAMYVMLPDRKDIDQFAFAMQLSLDKMMETARSAPRENVSVVLPRMTISGSFSLKEPLSKIKAMRRVSRSVSLQGTKNTESPGIRSTDSSRASDSSIYFQDFESSSDEHHWVKTLKKLRNTHRSLRSAPEPRSQDLKYPPMQITVGTNPSDSSFKRVFPQPLSSYGVDTNDSKDRESVMEIDQSGVEPRVALPLNKPMVMGVPLRIMDSDDTKVLPKAHHIFATQDKTPVKTYQQYLKEIDMPYPYLPGQEMKPPFDKPLKLITIKDILPKMVVETSVSFPADQNNESDLEGSRLTMRPSGLTISKKQRQSGSNTAIRSVEITQDKDLVSENSSSSRAFENENSTNLLPAWSQLIGLHLSPSAKGDVDSMRVSLNIPNSENANSRRNSTDGAASAFEPGNSSNVMLPYPSPILSFSSDVKISQPIPIISSSFHVEDTPLLPGREVNPSISSSASLDDSPAIPETSDSKDSFSNSNESLSSDEPFIGDGLSNTTAIHAARPTFPEVEETGDLLNPLAVGSYRPGIPHSQAPNSAGYDVELDLTGASTDRSLRVSDALHYVWLEVSETGTEAAAVTATIMDYNSQNKVMKVDRPFVFAIVHEPTEALLFLAAVSDPTGGAGIRTDIPLQNTG